MLQDEYNKRRKEYLDAYGKGDNWEEEGAKLHIDFYLWLADSIGLKLHHLPVSLEHIEQCKDVHFNTIQLKLWDNCDGTVRHLAHSAGMRFWSVSDTVCCLKAVAHRYRKERYDQRHPTACKCGCWNAVRP